MIDVGLLGFTDRSGGGWVFLFHFVEGVGGIWIWRVAKCVQRKCIKSGDARRVKGIFFSTDGVCCVVGRR